MLYNLLYVKASESDIWNNLGEIKGVNMKSENITTDIKDPHGGLLSKLNSYPTYTMTFDLKEPICREEFYEVLGMDSLKMPDTYDVKYIQYVQARKHKSKRINKKWLKRYGFKQIIGESKGWKIKIDKENNIEFIK